MQFMLCILIIALFHQLTSHSFLLDNPTDDSNLLFKTTDDSLDSNSFSIDSLDSTFDSLVFSSDDTTDLSSSTFATEDPNTELSMLADGGALDENQPQDFAELGNSCSAEGTGQVLSRVRRGDQTICSPQAPVPYLKLPTEDSLWNLFDSKKPMKEPETFPPRPPLGSSPDAYKCPHPAYTYPVCCRGPTRDKRISILPVPIWDVIEVCSLSKLYLFFGQASLLWVDFVLLVLPSGLCWLRYEACCLRYLVSSEALYYYFVRFVSNN
jgi:hypothetical protein